MSDSSQPQKEQIPPDFDQQRTETTDEERVAELLSEYTIGRDDHKNALAFVIRADDIQGVLTILRDDAGFDHLSLITPQEYEDRYYGDFTAIFQYAFRDREVVQDILEDLTGQRMMFYYFRLGGVAWDLPEPREEFFEKTRDFLDGLPMKIAEYDDLLTGNEVFQIRSIDTSILEPRDRQTVRLYRPYCPRLRGRY